MGDATLYDADVLVWSERQADLLRRLARGERGVNEAVDWENVIEEIESVGRAEFNEFVGHLEVALEHLLYIHASRLRDPVPHWRREVRAALGGALQRYSPSMARRLDLARSWRRARGAALEKLDGMGGPARPMPEECPWTVEELVAEEPDLDALLARLG